MDWSWIHLEWTWILGIVALGIALFVFGTRQRRLSRTERRRTEEATRELYDNKEAR